MCVVRCYVSPYRGLDALYTVREQRGWLRWGQPAHRHEGSCQEVRTCAVCGVMLSLSPCHSISSFIDLFLLPALLSSLNIVSSLTLILLPPSLLYTLSSCSLHQQHQQRQSQQPILPPLAVHGHPYTRTYVHGVWRALVSVCESCSGCSRSLEGG